MHFPNAKTTLHWEYKRFEQLFRTLDHSASYEFSVKIALEFNSHVGGMVLCFTLQFVANGHLFNNRDGKSCVMRKTTPQAEYILVQRKRARIEHKSICGTGNSQMQTRTSERSLIRRAHRESAGSALTRLHPLLQINQKIAPDEPSSSVLLCCATDTRLVDTN